MLMGGLPRGQSFPPTVLADVPVQAEICSEEAFAPVVVVSRFAGFDEAIERANASRFRLQAGRHHQRAGQCLARARGARRRRRGDQ
jgi:acyl-CoA reductase-like NAD-dependent aldehyde dehydrogenase